MPNEKKNLSKLLNKNKKKKENTTSSKKEDEEAKPAASANQELSNDAESPDMPKSAALAKGKQDNDDSSDDEIQYKIDIENKIIEQQADPSKNQDDLKADYMMKKDEDESPQVNPKEKVKRNNASNIVFGGGRPVFTRKNNAAGIGGDDFVGIDEIDDDGKQKKNQKKNTAAQGGREFENLGSTAVVKNKKFEEEKEKESKPAERPRFFGKAKIGGGDENKQSAGTNITYDFGVKYKTDNIDAKKSHSQKDDNQTEVRKDKRRINQEKGQRFGGKEQGLDDQDLDEGFEIVKDPNQKRRQQRVYNRTRDEDGEQREQRRDDDITRPQQSAPVKRAGAFGNLANDSD